MLISEAFSAIATKNGTKAALSFLGKDIRYSDIKNSIARLSYLYQNELGKEVKTARIAFFTSNSPAVVTTFLALTNNRVPIIPLNPELPPEELVAWLKQTHATHLAVTGDLLNRARDFLRDSHLHLPIIEIEKKHGGEYDTSYSAPPDHKPTDNDIVLVLRSGGISMKPKYINLNHKQVLHSVNGLKSHYRLMPTDRFLGVLSWSNPFALVHHMLFPILQGATTTIDHGLQAVEFLNFMQEGRITRLVGIPPFFLKLLVTCKNEQRLLPGIKSITVGMGPLIPEVKRTYELLKISALHTYGQVENVWTIAMEAFPSSEEREKQQKEPPREYRMGQVGRGIPGLKYKVVDANGDTIEGAEVRRGLLCVAGPTVMMNYLDEEKETKNKIRGTWLYTQDYAELEGEGEELKITFLSRKDDYLELDGEQVLFPKIDKILKKIPGVQDAASFVLPRSNRDRVVACAVIKVAGNLINEKSVLDACASSLPSGQVPRIVAFTDAIPRDQGGNVNLQRLRMMFEGAAG